MDLLRAVQKLNQEGFKVAAQAGVEEGSLRFAASNGRSSHLVLFNGWNGENTETVKGFRVKHPTKPEPRFSKEDNLQKAIEKARTCGCDG